MNNYTFEKRWMDAEHETFEVWYIDLVTGASTKRVDADKPLYLAWLAAGNAPTEIEFVPPPEPEPVPDWEGFEQWAQVNMIGKFLKVQGILPSLVLRQLTAHNLTALRDALSMCETYKTEIGYVMTSEEKSAINAAATSRNIGAVFV